MNQEPRRVLLWIGLSAAGLAVALIAWFASSFVPRGAAGLANPSTASQLESRDTPIDHGGRIAAEEVLEQPPTADSFDGDAHVVVLDALDSRPLVGAAIGVGPWTGPGAVAHAETDPQGRASLPRGERLWFAKSGFAPLVLDRAPLWARSNAHGTAEVRLHPVGELVVEVVDGFGNPIASVAVRVRSADTGTQGRALARALPRWIPAPLPELGPMLSAVPGVTERPAPEPGPPNQIAATGDLGTFHWHEAPVAAPLIVTVDGPIAQQSRRVELPAQTRHAHVRFAAQGSGVITGRFVRDGRGVPGEGVDLFDEQDTRTIAHADGNGRFRFEGVALGWAQLRSIAAVGWRHELEVTGEHDLGDIEIPLRVMAHGRVVSADRVAPGSLAVVGTLNGMALWYGPVEPDGRFSIEGPVGGMEIQLLASTAPPAPYPVLGQTVEFPWESLELPVDGHLARLELHFPVAGPDPPGTEVELILTSAETELPHMRGMEMLAFRSTSKTHIDEAGVATIAHLVPGDYSAWVRSTGGLATHIAELRLRAGETWVHRCEAPAETTLDVRVLGAGDNAATASVLFHGVGTEALVASLDREGNARFGPLPPGPGSVQLLSAAGRPLASLELNLEPGSNTAVLDASAVSSLSGRVLGLDADRTVRLSLTRWPSPTLPKASVSVRTDEQGAFDFGPMAPGLYRLTLQSETPHEPNSAVRQLLEVDLPAATVVTIDLQAPTAATTQVEFHLQGAPLTDVSAVEALARGPMGDLLHARGRARGGGRFEVPQFPGPTVYLLTPARDAQAWHGYFSELQHRYVAVDWDGSTGVVQSVVQIEGLAVHLDTERSPAEWPQVQPLEVAGVDLTLGVNAYTLAPLDTTSTGVRLAPVPAGSVLLVHDPKAPLEARVRRWSPTGAVEIVAD